MFPVQLPSEKGLDIQKVAARLFTCAVLLYHPKTSRVAYGLARDVLTLRPRSDTP